MDYIINPAIFYWMSVASSLKTVCLAGVMISVAIGIAAFVWLAEGYDDEDTQRWKQFLKIALVVVILSVVGLVFIPGEKTITQMLVANFATYDMAGNVVDAVKNAADYIIGAAKEVVG